MTAQAEIPMHFPFEAPLPANKRQKYTRLTMGAKKARACPPQSGYFVRTQILAENGKRYLGGNKEHALSDAFVHGETATISGLRDVTDSPIEAIAFHIARVGDKVVDPKNITGSCGACLDVLTDYCEPDTVILDGNETGIIFTRLKDYLFDKFQRGDPAKLSARQVELALQAARGGVDVYLPKHLKGEVYGAVLVGEKGATWQGSLYTNAGYDAVPPVMAGVLHWLNSYPKGKVSEKHLGLEKLVIAGRGNIPEVLYRDRQAILEIDELLRRWRGDDNPLPVEIVKVRGKDVSVKRTNVTEWLPHPFTPGAFRMDDVIFAELAKLVGKRRAKRAFN